MAVELYSVPFPEDVIDLSRCALPPFQHQLIGVKSIVRSPYFLLADEMGAGKTKQAIDAAQVLHVRGDIDKALIICPAPVRSVWFDREFGELRKHLWPDLCSMIIEFHKGKDRIWSHGKPFREPYMEWLITNYDYVRDGDGYDEILDYCTPRTLLILDESSSIKNHNAKQTKAAIHIRNKCGRVLLLNGTPITHSPKDMYAQGRVMNTNILGCRTFFDFRARYMVMGGWEDKQVIRWQNLDDLQNRFAPYVIRRLKKDCLDLPEKMPPVMLQPAMTEKTWRIYKDMRDQLVAWLSTRQVSVAAQAIVKVLRLAQITSGFLGGVEDEPEPDPLILDRPEWLPFEGEDQLDLLLPRDPREVAIIGDEKLAYFLDWLEEALYKKPNLKMIFWCRFKPELFRTLEAVNARFPQVRTAGMYGGQKKGDRELTKRLLDPRYTPPDSPTALCVGSTLGTGSVGLTLTAADTNFYLSLNRVLLHLLQSIDRTHRPTQVNPVSYYYCLATGPKGQKTVDHVIYGALENREKLATWTTDAWVKALNEE